MARILLGVSGGIAAYKALEFVRLATAAGHSVRVVQTETSTRFVGPDSFEALSGAPVLTTEWEPDPARGAFPGQRAPDHEPLNHLELVRNADAYLVAPATANTLARMAAGIADSLLTSCALAASCPLLVAPAMNHHMWRNAATQANVETLRDRGVTVIEPGVGALASRGEWGEGRLAEPAELLDAVEALVPSGARPWDGLRVLVTAGGTREPVDGVRFLGNRSSGRMGFALAQAAAARGGQVTLIEANTTLDAPRGVEVVSVETTAELAEACRRAFPETDLLLMAAAVADFRVAGQPDGKLSRDGEGLTLDLEPTEDIVGSLGAERRGGQVVVAFAAEHGGDLEASAAGKLVRKGADAVVVNDVSRADIGFESTENEVTIVTATGARQVPKAPKGEVAEAILDGCDGLLQAARLKSA